MTNQSFYSLFDYPEEMRSSHSWVLWRLEERDGRSIKMPYQINGYPAKSNDSKTWSSFAEALEALKQSARYKGIGYMFDLQSRIVFIDLDHCISETGELNQFAQDTLSEFPSAFVEVSQSGTGLHLFTVGSIPSSVKTKEIEMYAEKRFCAISGRIFRKTDHLHDEQEALNNVFQKYRKPEKPKYKPLPCQQNVSLSDSEIMQSAMNDKKFQRLYSGNYEEYESQSEADMALCMKIAFYAGRDPAAVDRIFRTSALYRPKWDKKHFSDGCTYGEKTVLNACQAIDETSREYIKRREREQFEEFNRLICGFGKNQKD